MGIYILSIVVPFIIVYILKQKFVHGVRTADNFLCRQGFHKLEIEHFDGNDYVERERCKLCLYVYEPEEYFEEIHDAQETT